MRWHESWIAIIVVLCLGEGGWTLRGSDLILAAKSKAAEEKLNPTTEELTVVVGEDGTNTTVVKTRPLLTGIPQIDYIHDPNLPRELNGYNLSEYPFFNKLPPDIKFECDGLHDGFYASVPHKCQVYHHCLYGTRYDFLCANYTAFDQKTFICHFVSEVDCVNSPKYFIRNEALYKQSETTTQPTTTKATTTTTTTTTTPEPTRKMSGRRRRPYRRRRPAYEYYYDDDSYDDEYYDEEDEAPPRKSSRRQQKPSGKKEEPVTTTTTTTVRPTAAPGSEAPLTRAPLSVYAPRALPKIKRPVPINEKSKYDYTTKAGMKIPAPTSDPLDDDEEYYDDEYEDEPPPPPPPPPKKKDSGKNRRRMQPQNRKRPSRYDYDEYEDEHPRMKKGNRKEEDYRPRSRGSTNQRKGYRDEVDEEPVAPERPGFVSRGSTRKRPMEERRRRPAKEYEYYDEEEPHYENERRRAPHRKNDKPRITTTRATTTTPTTTTSKTTTTTTTTTPAPLYSEEDEEYEYDEPEPVQPKFRSRDRVDVSTTLAPHRFSTSSYRDRNSKFGITEASKAKVERFRRPEFRRPMNKSEAFNSQVGSPTGFRRHELEKVIDDSAESSEEEPKYKRRESYKPEQEKIKVDIVEVTEEPKYKRRESSKRPEPEKSKDYSDEASEEEPKYKRREEESRFKRPETTKRPEVSRRPSTEDLKRPETTKRPTEDFKRAKVETNFQSRRPYKEEESRERTNFRDYQQSTQSTTEQTKSYKRVQEPVTRAPEYTRRPQDFKKQEPTATGPEIIQDNRRPFRTDIIPPTAPASEAPFRRPYGQDSQKRPDYSRRPQKTEVFLPESYQRPQDKPDEFRRPTAPESYKRPSSERQEDRYRRPVKPDILPQPPLPTAPDNYKKEETYKRPYDNYDSQDSYRRPAPTGIGVYRRRPTNDKNVDDIYPKEQPSGPNYRNPFLNTRPVKEEQEFFNPPKTVDFTAPGPSGEGSTQQPLSSYGDEYDVTLNDALQPATLHPTLHFPRLKTRGYQSAVTHPSYRSLLLTSASQNFYSKVPVQDKEQYEAVVMPAARFTQSRFKHRPDWYW